MTSDTNKPSLPGKAEDDKRRAADAIGRETQSARDEATKTGQRIRDEASGLAEKAKERAGESADQGKEAVAGSMEDFAAAVRKASDELGDRDQSMAANVVREVASGLEDASRSLHGRSVQDLTRSVAGFARRQPTAFLVGAALAGVALGRFARASSEHEHYDDRDSYDSSTAGRPVPTAVRPSGTMGARPSPSTAASSGGASGVTTPSSAGVSSSTAPLGGTPTRTPSGTTSTNTSGGNHGR
ncbi:MAG TPA: hypothetical protein VIN77_16380 [Aurantimonas sp.]